MPKDITLAIEKQIQLKQQVTRLVTINNTLEATLSFVDEGIVMLDEKGAILRSNKEGMKIFRLKKKTRNKEYLSNFLRPDSELMKLIVSGGNINYVEEIVKIGEEEHAYLFSSRPVFNQDNSGIKGAVVRLNNCDNIHTLLANRSSTARFTFDRIIGESEVLKNAKKVALRFASLPENVLLTGESGTGKDLFAQSIHNASRSHGPFIALNCSAMHSDLVESELFGYEGGELYRCGAQGASGKNRAGQQWYIVFR